MCLSRDFEAPSDVKTKRLLTIQLLTVAARKVQMLAMRLMMMVPKGMIPAMKTLDVLLALLRSRALKSGLPSMARV